jgi:2-keto-3-deoxy-L-rhamnonate aldolase RhmA
MIGRAGFDWTWIDCEHGSGSEADLIHQIQVARLGPAPAVVRVPANETSQFKRVLDLGAAGVMVPYINTADEARQAAQSMRYQPAGLRGVTSSSLASSFSLDFDDYYARANDSLVSMIQIETGEAVANAERIAAVEGVDVLFVGPNDLSVSMGMAKQFKAPAFEDSLRAVVTACRKHGKAAGILAPTMDFLAMWKDMGYTVFIVGSDATNLARMMAGVRADCAKFKA